jgi:pimeloyl-ACP methyl ester carboxylesterase
VPVYQIHGADDELIPVKRVKADVVVAGAGHLVNVTHAEAVNAFLAARIG